MVGKNAQIDISSRRVQYINRQRGEKKDNRYIRGKNIQINKWSMEDWIRDLDKK